MMLDKWSKCWCKPVRWALTRASYPRLMKGHQKSLVSPDLCVKVEVLCIFLWWRLMMFIRCFMGFVNQKLSTKAVVGPWRIPCREILVWFNWHLGKLAPVGFWGTDRGRDILRKPPRDGS